MATVLEEVTGDDVLTPDHVRRRLDDWEQRIRGLYRTIETWTADVPNLRTEIHESAVRLLEEPMRESHIDARRLPDLRIYADGEPRARLEPRGLWIIGANGRLDLAVGLNRFLIVDTAENFSPTEWVIMSAEDRMERRPFSRSRFLRAVDPP